MKIRNGTTMLDSFDWKILELLQGNSKQTYTEIGKQLGVAHSTIYDRIQKMERFGIIKKYTVLIDNEKIGAKNITAIMTIYTDPKESEHVAIKLSQVDEVIEVCTSISEELSIIAKVVAKDQEQLHDFIANQIAPLPGVLRIRTAIITKKYKEEPFSVGNSR
jgi:Lrp/AsnC family transcriptional regulator for asnA, asnC and gidA